MKALQILLLAVSLLLGFASGIIITNLDNKQETTNTPKVILPEEYMLMSANTPIIGYYDENNTIHIEFDHSIQFVWNDVEESIPMDGSLITLEFTDENTVYIGPYDPNAKIN